MVNYCDSIIIIMANALAENLITSYPGIPEKLYPRKNHNSHIRITEQGQVLLFLNSDPGPDYSLRITVSSLQGILVTIALLVSVEFNSEFAFASRICICETASNFYRFQFSFASSAAVPP